MRKLYWMAIAVFFFIFACTKIESTDIGSGLIPPVDGVTTLDTTLEVITENFIDPLADSLRVYKEDDHVIGVINNDPLFGRTTATTFFELKPTFYKYFFPGGSTLNVDSAVLILSYKGVFGDTTIPQNWEVREVAETMKNDTIYTVSQRFATGSVLGSKTIVIPRLQDSVNYGFEHAKNQIRIKLSSSFATRLMKQFDSTGNNAYVNDSLFRQHFKGFAVMPAAGTPGNALIRINLVDTNTKLALFYNYKSDTSATRDTAVSYFRFSLGSGGVPVSANANYIKRDYAGSQLASATSTGAVNDSLVYIQTAPGTFATVKIPGLRTLPNSIIHSAELLTYQVVDEVSGLADILTPPRYVLLSSYDSVKRVAINIPNDFVIGSSGENNLQTFGGYLLQQDVPGAGIVKSYRFNLSRYVQGIVTRKDSSYTLRLSAPSNDSLLYTYPYPNTTSTIYYFTPSIANNIAIGRVRLGGGMHLNQPLRMRLRIIYSKL